jgi:hypothetical protein
MTVDEAFESPRLLLDRAREHFAEFGRRERAFLSGKPYAHVTDSETKPGYNIYKLRFTAAPPKSITPVAADAFNNIRHALDQAVVASALAVDPDADIDQLAFPIGDVETQFEGIVRRKCNRVHPEVVDYIRTLKPYKGGNRELLALSKFSGVNKHQFLAEAGGAASDSLNLVSRDAHTPEQLVAKFKSGFRPIGKWDRENNEFVICVSPLSYETDDRIETRLHIVLHNQRAGLRVPALDFMMLTGVITQNVVRKIEAITRSVVAP